MTWPFVLAGMAVVSAGSANSLDSMREMGTVWPGYEVSRMRAAASRAVGRNDDDPEAAVLVAVVVISVPGVEPSAGARWCLPTASRARADDLLLRRVGRAVRGEAREEER